MEKYALLFLIVTLLSCSSVEEKGLITKFTQDGKTSTFQWRNKSFSINFDSRQNIDTVFDADHSFQRIIDREQNIDLWVFSIDQTSVFGINGEIPFDLMIPRESSIAVISANAALPGVLALNFSSLILLGSIPNKMLAEIGNNYKGIISNGNIRFETDGIFWQYIEVTAANMN